MDIKGIMLNLTALQITQSALNLMMNPLQWFGLKGKNKQTDRSVERSVFMQ